MESLLAVDDAVKRIVGRLRKTGDLRKTYIVFTSDNGLQLGAHRLLFKDFLYEESTRVPLVIRGPGFPAGAVRQQLVSNVDLAPTIVQLTKARAGLTMDGRSLLPFAADACARAPAASCCSRATRRPRSGCGAATASTSSHDSGEEELYDLARRPVRSSRACTRARPHLALKAQLARRGWPSSGACSGARLPLGRELRASAASPRPGR